MKGRPQTPNCRGRDSPSVETPASGMLQRRASADRLPVSSSPLCPDRSTYFAVIQQRIVKRECMDDVCRTMNQRSKSIQALKQSVEALKVTVAQQEHRLQGSFSSASRVSAKPAEFTRTPHTYDFVQHNRDVVRNFTRRGHRLCSGAAWVKGMQASPLKQRASVSEWQTRSPSAVRQLNFARIPEGFLLQTTSQYCGSCTPHHEKLRLRRVVQG